MDVAKVRFISVFCKYFYRKAEKYPRDLCRLSGFHLFSNRIDDSVFHGVIHKNLIHEITCVPKLGMQINTIPLTERSVHPAPIISPKKACVHFGHKLLFLKNVNFSLRLNKLKQVDELTLIQHSSFM